VQELTADQIKAQRAGRERDLLHVLLSAATLPAQALPDTATVGGKATDVVAIRSELVPGWKIYLDRVSHRILRMEFRDRSLATGQPATRQENYSSFMQVDGLYWPQTRTIFLDGAPVLTLRVTAAKLNSGVSPELFKKPAASPN